MTVMLVVKSMSEKECYERHDLYALSGNVTAILNSSNLTMLYSFQEKIFLTIITQFVTAVTH